MKLKVLIRPESRNGYVVRIPTLPGCASQGRTVEEALKNLRAAAESWLEQAMNDLDVEVVPELADDDQQAMEQAMAIEIPPHKLKQFVRSHPPDASWYQEKFDRS